ncbi:hypothetical protein ACFQ1I_08440 [Kitasatospora arboriphila]
MSAENPRPSPQAFQVPRRAVLLGLAGVVLGACSSRTGTAASSASPPAPATSSPPATSPAASSAALPATMPWQPGPGEIDPDVKLRATQLVEALGAWPAGGQGLAAARDRVRALGLDPTLADQAGPLLGTAPQAVLQVVNAQWGGHLTDSASVMVPCRQWTTEGSGAPPSTCGWSGRSRAGTSRPCTRRSRHRQPPPSPTRRSGCWPSRGSSCRSAAVADVRGGGVHESVLASMLTLAGRYSYAVTVLRSGHPIDVFGTSRPSDHPPGRAFDVWRIDGHEVVDPATPHDLVDGFMRAAAASGSYNVGGPRQLSGGTAPNQFFTDDAHHDHVHVGFRS